MRRTIVRIGATGVGALLALALFAAPPAAADGSGRRGDRQGKAERSGKVDCFNAEGRTQGRSLSDPDGDSNGGADKPGCNGGFDADKDGNNGCGNDADREDDNNGNCGRKGTELPGDVAAEQQNDGDDKVKTETVDADVKAQDAGSVSDAGALAAEASSTTDATAATTVLGASLTAPAESSTSTSTTTPDTQVLGETLSAPDTLARTGAGIGGLALLGGLLVGGGRLTVLARRLLRIG